MTKNTSYKSMLRDRVPKIVELALKWCKAKECWVNHVYNNFVRIYVDKEMRYEATRIALGLSKSNRNFDFHKTIDWDNLTKEEKSSWTNVENWVIWFQNVYGIIEDDYKMYKHKYNETEMEMYIVDHHINTIDEETAYKLCEYIISTL